MIRELHKCTEGLRDGEQQGAHPHIIMLITPFTNMVLFPRAPAGYLTVPFLGLLTQSRDKRTGYSFHLLAMALSWNTLCQIEILETDIN